MVYLPLVRFHPYITLFIVGGGEGARVEAVANSGVPGSFHPRKERDMGVFRKTRWSPYAAGALTGLLICLSVLVADKYLGASTTFVRAAGIIERAVAPESVSAMPYFVKTKIKVDWQMMLVVGIVFGALFSSRMSGDFKSTQVPPMWRSRFGPSRARRFFCAFFGGIIALFGARLAGGCPSGHGLSGLAQMSVSGYVSLIFFFAAGMLTARILYGKGE